MPKRASRRPANRNRRDNDFAYIDEDRDISTDYAPGLTYGEEEE
jgi:hypothetical protein